MQSYKIALILAMLSINFDGHPKGCCGCFILQMWNAKVFGFSYKKPISLLEVCVILKKVNR